MLICSEPGSTEQRGRRGPAGTSRARSRAAAQARCLGKAREREAHRPDAGRQGRPEAGREAAEAPPAGHPAREDRWIQAECGAPLQAVAEPRERRKPATLVFCDVAGSTTLGERVDPEAVQASMLSYFAEARAVLERHGGTVEKFSGDAVVAAFGVPQAHEDDALRPCRAALEIQSRLSSRITLRIGVNTGEVVARDPSARETFVTVETAPGSSRLAVRAADRGGLAG